MKNKTTYTVRPKNTNQRNTFYNEEDAFRFAEETCLKQKREVAVIMHVGDTSRLIRKVFFKGWLPY